MVTPSPASSGSSRIRLIRPHPLKGDFEECSFTPPGRIDPATGLQLVCPWRAFDDPGSGIIGYTFARPGTFGVLVMALDSNGAISQEQFNVIIGNLAPTLTVQSRCPR